MSVEKKWRTFEKLVAAIHRVEQRISFVVQVIPARGIRNAALDPYVLMGGYRYANVVTGELYEYKKKDLDTGIDTEVRDGFFYADAFTDFRYYCNGVNGDELTMTMLEGYQHGRHLQATFRVLRENARSYFEITDEAEIAGLRAMAASLERIGGSLKR